MKSTPRNIYEIPEEAIEEILETLLRSPGATKTLERYLANASSQPLAVLYDIWASAHESENALNAYWIFVNDRNVNIGICEDENEPMGLELFSQDLSELCIAINTHLETRRLNPLQKEQVSRAQKYFSQFQKVNPGHLSIMRGWYDLGDVFLGGKNIVRCAREGCGRLVITDAEGYLLSGTPEGYHSEGCRDADVVADIDGFKGMEANIEMTPDGPEIRVTQKVDEGS